MPHGCTQVPFGDADRADTRSVPQQLLGVVDGADDSCPPAAGTAMTVTAGCWWPLNYT